MPIMFYTMVEAQCSKVATVVSSAKIIALATADVPWQNFPKFRIQDKFQDQSTRIIGDT